jgi:uncharacterized repeat protein (TIGR02543 family)
VSTTPQFIVIDGALTDQKVVFDYRSTANDIVVVNAVKDSAPAEIIQTYSIQTTVGGSVSVNAPQISGWQLVSGSSDTATAPGTITFRYVPDVVTITVNVTSITTGYPAIPAPYSNAVTYTVDKNGTFTAYAPHIPGYVITGDDSKTFTNVQANDIVTFKYQYLQDYVDNNFVTITVEGKIQSTNTVLYSYKVLRQKDSGNLVVNGFEISGYTWVGKPLDGKTTVIVGGSDRTVTYEYVTLTAYVTINAVIDSTGLTVPGFTSFDVPAVTDDPFTYKAPYIANYVLVGALSQTIPAVGPSARTMTFRYMPAIGDVLILLKETDTNGPVIKTVVASLPTGVNQIFLISAYDLSTDFYSFAPSGQNHNLTGTGTQQTIEFYYEKQTSSLTREAIDVTGGSSVPIVLSPPLAPIGPYRVGETINVIAPTITGYRYVGAPVRSVTVTGAAQTIQFTYERTGLNDVTVRARHGTTNAFYDYTVKTTPGNDVTVEAPVIIGWKLLSGQPASQSASSGVIEFFYESDEITITVNVASTDGLKPILPPYNASVTYTVPRGLGYTVYAPHIPDYILDSKTVAPAVPSAGSQSQVFANLQANQTVTFTYAPMPPEPATVILDYNGGTRGGNAFIVLTGTAGSSVGAVINPTREGHTFAGWLLGGSPATPLTFPGAGLTQIYVAQWTPDTYTVRFNNEAGMQIVVVDVSYGMRISTGTLPDAPVKTNYNFVGWNDGSGTYSATAILNYIVTGDVTFTASYVLTTTAPPPPPPPPLPPPPPPPPNESIVFVDGHETEAGKVTVNNGKTTVTVNQDVINAEIKGAKDNVTVKMPSGSTGTTEALFVLKNVNDMAEKRMTLSVQVGDVQYDIPATAVDTAAIMAALGASDPSKVPVSIAITTKVDTQTRAFVQKSIDGAELLLVMPPLDFTVTATYNGKTIEVTKYIQYVSHTVEITEEQARLISSAIVVEPDGTTRHVPTNIYQKGGKWYATVNSLTNSIYAMVNNRKSFTDAVGKWYEAAVTEMGSRGIISGIGNDLFAGERDLTRAEFAAIVVRALGLPSNGNGTVFTDVPASSWYCGAVGTAYEYGLVNGVGGGRFDPYRSITREEAMTLVQRASQLTGFKGAMGNANIFTDAGDISAWAMDSVKWIVGSGLISGDVKTLHPKTNISRAETAALVLKLLQLAKLVDIRTVITTTLIALPAPAAVAPAPVPAPAADSQPVTPPAVSTPETIPEEAFFIYTVVSGDNLTVIAKRFNTTITAIKELNNLKSDVITIGQKLKIPK